MSSWVNNPKIPLRLTGDGRNKYQRVFVGLYINDTRITLGAEYYKDALYCNPLAFDIVLVSDLGKDASERVSIIEASGYRPQPPYMFGTTQIEVDLMVETDYVIVPSLFKRSQPGAYYVDIQCETPFTSDMRGIASSMVAPDLSKEKLERLRERLANEASRLGISYSTVAALFGEKKDEKGIPKSILKRRLMDVGFNLTDIPDDDLSVLDQDDSGLISAEEFVAFFKLGLHLNDPKRLAAIPPSDPVDDLLYQTADLNGILTANIIQAKALALGGVSTGAKGSILRYDPSYNFPRQEKVIAARALPASRGSISTRRPSDALLGMSSQDLDEYLSPRSVFDTPSTIHMSEEDSLLLKKARNNIDLRQSDLKRSAFLSSLRKDRAILSADEPKEEGVLRAKVKVLHKKDLSELPSIERDHVVREFLAFKSVLLGLEKASNAPDIWEIILDNVFLICESRVSTPLSDILQTLESKYVRLEQYPLPSSPVKSKLKSTGTIPPPRNMKATPGIASVTGKLSILQQNDVLKNARDKLQQLNGSRRFEELWRRLVVVPVIPGCEGGDPQQILRTAFRSQDKAITGCVAFTDFRKVFHDVAGVQISEEEYLSIQYCLSSPGNLNSSSLKYNQFLAFLDTIAATSSDWDFVDALETIRVKLGGTIRDGVPSSTERKFLLPGFSDENTFENMEIFRAHGIAMSKKDLQRIGTVFDGSAETFQLFLLLDPSISILSLLRSVQNFLAMASFDEFRKSWSLFPELNGATSSVTLEQHFLSAIGGLKSLPSASLASTLSRLLVDNIFHSQWNYAFKKIDADKTRVVSRTVNSYYCIISYVCTSYS